MDTEDRKFLKMVIILLAEIYGIVTLTVVTIMTVTALLGFDAC